MTPIIIALIIGVLLGICLMAWLGIGATCEEYNGDDK